MITQGRVLDDQSRLYLVGIGTGKQAMSDYLFLIAYAADNDCYFKPVSLATDAFIERCEVSVHTDFRMHARKVSARDLVRALKTSTDVPVSENQMRNYDYFLKSISLNYRVISNLRNFLSA